MRNINYIRLYKGLLLLIELVSLTGGKMTECYCNNSETSLIKWIQHELINKSPTPKQYKLWNDFKTWL